MRWEYMTNTEKFDKRIQAECVWHKRFAWIPITVVQNGQHYRVWLEYVGCKKMVYYRTDDDFGGYRDVIGRPKYCFIEDLLFNALKDSDIIDERGI